VWAAAARHAPRLRALRVRGRLQARDLHHLARLRATLARLDLGRLELAGPDGAGAVWAADEGADEGAGAGAGAGAGDGEWRAQPALAALATLARLRALRAELAADALALLGALPRLGALHVLGWAAPAEPDPEAAAGALARALARFPRLRRLYGFPAEAPESAFRAALRRRLRAARVVVCDGRDAGELLEDGAGAEDARRLR